MNPVLRTMYVGMYTTAAALMHHDGCLTRDGCEFKPEREGLQDQVATTLGSDAPTGLREDVIRRIIASTHSLQEGRFPDRVLKQARAKQDV